MNIISRKRLFSFSDISEIEHQRFEFYKEEEILSEKDKEKVKKGSSTGIDLSHRSKERLTSRHNLIDILSSSTRNLIQFTNDILKPVTKDDELRCREVWSACKKKSEETVKVSGEGKGIKLIERHMYRLKPDEWLFDEQVNAFMSILQRVDDLVCLNDPNRKKCFYFHSEFFNQKIDVPKEQYATNQRRTIMKIIKKRGSLFNMSKLFFPVNVRSSHWILIVVYIQKKTIRCFDSQIDKKKHRQHQLEAVSNFVLEEERMSSASSSLDSKKDDWCIQTSNSRVIPQQINSNDCGVKRVGYDNYAIISH